MRVWSLGQEYPMEQKMATHSSMFSWRIPWTQEPGRLQSMGSQRVGHDWAPKYRQLYGRSLCPKKAYLVAQRLKCLPAMQETWVRSLGREDPLQKEMATHSSILAWRIPWTEEPGRLQSTGLQRVGHDWVTTSLTSLCSKDVIGSVSQSHGYWVEPPTDLE